MLRGYDPFKELYRWVRVFYLLAGLATAVMMLSLGGNNSNEGTDAFSIGLAFFSLMISPAIFLIYVLLLRPYSKDQKTLLRRRSEALTGQNLQVVIPQPQSPATPLKLPCKVSRRALRISPAIASGLLVMFAALMLLSQLPLLSPDLSLPPWISSLRPLASLLMVLANSILLGIPFLIMTGYYLLPELDIDEEGITARYGRQSVRIIWQNVRYFAVVNTRLITTHPSIGKQFAYEICDGENVMSWFARAENTLAYKPLMPAEDYDLLMNELLPSYITHHIGQPLLDLKQCQ